MKNNGYLQVNLFLLPLAKLQHIFAQTNLDELNFSLRIILKYEIKCSSFCLVKTAQSLYAHYVKQEQLVQEKGPSWLRTGEERWIFRDKMGDIEFQVIVIVRSVMEMVTKILKEATRLIELLRYNVEVRVHLATVGSWLWHLYVAR